MSPAVWTFVPVDFRGGVVGELDIKADCSDGRTELITVMRWPVGWRAPLYLDSAAARAVLRVARDTEAAGAIA